MSQTILNRSLVQPCQAGQFLQIDSGSLTIVDQADEQKLPELLQKLPSIIQAFAKETSFTFEERISFHGRILQLKTQVGNYNKEVDASFWIAVLHVILFLLTFGAFDYKATWRLEKPIVFLKDFLPDSFDPKEFLETYTAGQFRALGDEARAELALLAKFDADTAQTFMTGADEKSLAELLLFKTPSSSGISTPTPFEEFDLAKILASDEPLAKEEIQSLSADLLVEQLGLTNLTNQEVFEQKKLPLIYTHLKKLLPLLTQNQWETVPEALFFLFVLRVCEEDLSFLPELGNSFFQTLYTLRDPDLIAFPKLIQNMEIGSKAALIIHLFHDPSKDSGQTTSPISANIPNLSSKTIAELITMSLLFERSLDSTCQTASSILRRDLLQFVPLTQLPNLPIEALSKLYRDAEENSPLQKAVNQEISKRTKEPNLSTASTLLEKQNSEVISYVCKEIETLCPQRFRTIYLELLSKTEDLNAQYEGWSILHYTLYQIENLILTSLPSSIAFIQYLLTHGANLQLQDLQQREPIYFFQSDTEGKYDAIWNILIQNGAKVNPENRPVTPLHTAAILGNGIEDFLKRGANPYARDKFQRTPLHCAAIHSQYFSAACQTNITCLLDYSPEAIGWKDSFGNYPLYYGMLFGFSEIQIELLAASSVTVIEEVFAKISEESFPQGEIEILERKGAYSFYDPIYRVPGPLLILKGGGGPQEKKKKEALEALSEAKKSKQVVIHANEKTYYAHHDGHGWKHCALGKEALIAFKQKREFIANTRSGSAKFFPSSVENRAAYEKLTEQCIQTWIAQGANETHPYVEMPEPIGADDGYETNTIEIYGLGSVLGAHIRPKHLL